MDSTPFSSSGSLFIRAPLTADSDSECECESNTHETESSVGGGGSLKSCDESNSELFDESESERFLSVDDDDDDEFETASEMERPFTLEDEINGGFSGSYKIYVADKDDDDIDNSLENSMVGEEDGVEVGIGLVVDGYNSNQAVPIARLSMEDEVFDEMLIDGEMVNEVENVVFSPRIKMAVGVEGGEEQEEESLELRSSGFLSQFNSSMSVKAEVENGGFEDLDKGLGGFSGVANVPGNVETSPRMKMALGVGGGEEEEESLELRSSDFLSQFDSSMPVNAGGLEDLDKGPSLQGSQKDVLVEIFELNEDFKHSADKSIAMENPSDETMPVKAENGGFEDLDKGLSLQGSRKDEISELNADFKHSADKSMAMENPSDETMLVKTDVENGGFEDLDKGLSLQGSRKDEISKLNKDFKHSADKSIAMENPSDETMPVKTEVENGGFKGLDKGLSLQGSRKDEISELNEDFKHSADKSIAMENPGDERIELNHENGDEIEEESSVKVNDPNYASQPVLEPIDKIVVSDLKELMSDVTDCFKVSAPMSVLNRKVEPEVEDRAKHVSEKGLLSDEDVVQMIFGSSESDEQLWNEVEHGLTFTSLLELDSEDRLGIASEQIVMHSDEEVEEAERENDAKELFDSAALVAILKAATGAESDGGGVTITSPGGPRVFSLDHPAHSGSAFHSSKVASPSNVVHDVPKDNVSDEDKKRFEKLQPIRVKFLRLVLRLGHSPTDPMVAQVLHRLALASGCLSSQEFTLESAKRAAMELEAEGKDGLDFSLNILVLGKTGVGKSASINSIFRDQKSGIDAFKPATTAVKEIVGTVGGVKIRIFDTPGLRSPVTEEATNRKLLASIKRFVRKFPPDVVLYVDRLDAHDKDLTDILLLKSLTDSLGSSIWQNAIVTLTHAASASAEGPLGKPLSFEAFVAQRSHVVHRAISQVVGDPRLTNPSMMHPVALVENHPSCERDGNGEILLPNGQTWRSQLLLLCYSVKILSEASSLSKPQDPFDRRKLFGFRLRSPPLPYLLSSLLQSRSHPKLSNNQGGEDVDLDIEFGDSTNSDEQDSDGYDQLSPFKPLSRSQVDKLSKEQRKAYFEEYDYRVKLLQKKQWRDEVKRSKEIKKKQKDGDDNSGYVRDNGDVVEGDPAATVPVPFPDMVLPPSFDGDNPTYRYRFLDSASQLLMRPVLDSQVWDHDIGYDGVSLERSLAIAGYYPGAFAVQITKDKKEFNIHLDSSICAKHGENGSTTAGFDIQTVGKQLAYIFLGETKFRNFKINQTTAGLSVTFLGENVATGLKIEDRIAVGNRLVLSGGAGAMTSRGDIAYGANVEIRLKDKDFPVEQNPTTFGLSLVKWQRELGLTANLQSQFSIGLRGSSMAVRVGLNNKQSGQINLKVSSSEQLHIAAIASFLPIAASILRMIFPGSDLSSSY